LPVFFHPLLPRRWLDSGPETSFPLYCAGAKLVDYYGLGVLTPGLGIFHLVFSYAGKLTLSVLADRNIMPDPELYRECLVASYEEMHQAIGGSEKALKAKTDPAPKAKTKSKARSKPKAKVKTKAKVRPKLKSKPRAKAQPKLRVAATAKAKVKAKPKTKPKAKAKRKRAPRKTA